MSEQPHTTEHDYAAHMEFKSPREHPFEAGVMSDYLRQLGVANPEVTVEEAAAVRACYENPYRSYHAVPHGEFVGQDDVPEALTSRLTTFTATEAAALNGISGLFHDAVYMHVDDDGTGTKAWSDVVVRYVGGEGGVARIEDGEPMYRTSLTDIGKQDGVTRMVAHVFGVDPEGEIGHKQGGNEFVSALLAVKFLESKGASAKVMVGAAAAIAATVPFRPATGSVESGNPDGHMGELAGRVRTAQLQLGDEQYQPSWEETNDIMHLSVHLANRDIAPFIQFGNFGAVIDNGRKVKKEEIPELRGQVTNVRQLLRAASLERSAPLLYRWLGSGEGPVSAANVPHFYVSRDGEGHPLHDDETMYYPPRSVYDEAVTHAENNSRLSAKFFEAHEVSITWLYSLANAIGEPEAEIPGLVYAEDWTPTAMPAEDALSVLNTPDELMLYWQLMRGVGVEALDAATPGNSPIAGVLFGVTGSQGIAELSARISQLRQQARERGVEGEPFDDKTVALGFMREVYDRIGPHNQWLIINELYKVAMGYAHNPDRAARLSEFAAGVPAEA